MASNDVEMQDQTLEATQKTNFKLSKIIQAHKADVKAVLATSQGTLITGSRDEMVKLWVERKGSFHSTVEFQQHGKLAVNSVAFYQTPDSGDWFLFVGRKDGTIAVYNSANSDPCVILREHKHNVCVLYVDSTNKVLMSGSWDHQAFVWPIETILSDSGSVNALTGHRNSVWAVTSFQNTAGLYLTGSADRTIKLWEGDRDVKTFTGHEDVVRALVVLSETTFISAANDSTLRIWEIENGTCLQTFHSLTTEYIYSLTKVHLKSGEEFLANTTEKGYLEIWKLSANSLEPHSLIRTPTTSLWSITTLKNGDIAVAASNGSVYIFTSHQDRIADPNIVEVFDSDVAALVAMELNAKEQQDRDVVTIKVALDDGAPNLELKYVKGSDPVDAAEQFIRENNIPMSYLNEIVEYIKANIPEARMAEAAKYKKQPTQRVEVDGEKYDYSFQANTDDGRQMNIGYNIGEDPDVAAQRTVEKYNLPVKYLSVFSKFLRAQVPELSGAPSSGGYADPFTGSGRYVPQSQSSTNGGSSFADPFTGGGRYVPGSAPADAPVVRGPIDKKRPRSELVPLKENFLFGYEASSAKAIEKLMENNTLVEDALSSEELGALIDIFKSPDYAVTDDHVIGLQKGLGWPLESIIPVLDVFRLALLNPSLNNVFCSIHEGQGRQTIQRLTNLLVSDPADPIRILVCRSFTNAAAHQSGQEMLRTDFSMHVSLLVRQLSVMKGPVQLAAASALANLSLILLKETEQGDVMELGPREDALRAVIGGTEKIQSFGDHLQIALIRLMQTIATLMWGDSAVIKLAKDRKIDTIVNRIRDAVSEEAAKRLALDILGMLWSI